MEEGGPFRKEFEKALQEEFEKALQGRIYKDILRQFGDVDEKEVRSQGM